MVFRMTALNVTYIYVPDDMSNSYTKKKPAVVGVPPYYSTAINIILYSISQRRKNIRLADTWIRIILPNLRDFSE